MIFIQGGVPGLSNNGNEEAKRVDAWFQFVKRLPKLPPTVSMKLRTDVYEFLGIDERDLKNVNLFDVNKEDLEEITLDPLEVKTGFGYKNVIAPPVSNCLLCDKTLHLHNKPTNVVIHGFNGPRIATTYILRCKRCPEANGGPVNYRSDMFGNEATGWVFL